METKINSLPPLQTQRVGESRTEKSSTTSSNSTDTAPSKSSGDRVQLTDSARTLQQVERGETEGPEMDIAHVERISKELANNTYSVVPERIAAKLLAFERQANGEF